MLQKFEDPNWDTEEKAGGDKFAANQKQVIDLLTKMQDCGPPPKEILGDMPAGTSSSPLHLHTKNTKLVSIMCG